MHIFPLAASESYSNPHVFPYTLRFSVRLFLASTKICTFFKAFLLSLVLLFSFLVSLSAFAQDDYLKKFDKYTVYFSVFPSTAITPDIAQRYELVRGKNRVYVNIAVVPNDQSFGGVAAKVSGVAANLMQQQKPLEFKAIEEPNATYYLAALRHSDREIFHFTIDVKPDEHASSYQVKFTKELYLGQ